VTGWLLAYAGLARPYRFERTLAALATLLLAGLTAAAALFFYLTGRLSADSPRELYFLYLAALLALAFLLVPLPRLAAVPLTVAALEIGLGFGSAALHGLGISRAAVLPANALTFYRNFTWHPLLQTVPAPSRPGDWRQTDGYHNAQRLRGRERTADEVRSRIGIELFGGSTTYDVGAEDGETWGDRLETLLGADRYAVLNHGVPAFSSALHVIQTAFYERPYGEQPACAIYYLGWNELPNAHIRDLDPAYADYQVRSQTDTLNARRTDGMARLVSPTVMLATRLLVQTVDTVRPTGRPPEASSSGSGPDLALEAIYARNIRTISAINRQRGIRTLWIGQVMSRERMTRGNANGWVLFVTEKDMWPLIQRLNAILRREAEALDDIYVDVPAERFTASDFFDIGHFVESGSRKFAALLAPVVAEACSAAPPGGR
jgi:lysophospholipase L1-like esterase